MMTNFHPLKLVWFNMGGGSSGDYNRQVAGFVTVTCLVAAAGGLILAMTVAGERKRA